jgi:hypothetical protein
VKKNKKRVVVVDYDPAWRRQFAEGKTEFVLRILHAADRQESAGNGGSGE